MRPRIVGALVLGALAVILLPILLDFGGEYVVDTRTQIPDRPEIIPVEIAEPQAAEGDESVTTAEQMFRFNSSRDEAESDPKTQSLVKPEAPGLSDEGLPVAWILQVASFGDSDKAASLVNKLLANQYQAYSRASTTKGKTIHRVYVGPKILKQDMLDEKTAIEKKYKLKTLLLRFEP
ncbi:MAG: SPOR domain-containing protein [Porticoccaceae bacterium]|nr:SPOR domain-containing protein [Porticoccaceae bacterium]